MILYISLVYNFHLPYLGYIKHVVSIKVYIFILERTKDDRAWKRSYGFQLEEEGGWDGLFHNRIVVQEKSCAMTINHMSLINNASIEIVEKLDLPMPPRAQPYLFRWGHKEFGATHQTKVPFCWENIFARICVT